MGVIWFDQAPWSAFHCIGWRYENSIIGIGWPYKHSIAWVISRQSSLQLLLNCILINAWKVEEIAARSKRNQYHLKGFIPLRGNSI